jgi:predicted negative regulator of RcsB-dependent stress response
MNTLGYIFLKQNKIKESLIVLKLNTESNPNSSNAFDSYGEVLLKSGNKVEAIKAYNKSLKLDPNNDNAKRVLKSLKE